MNTLNLEYLSVVDSNNEDVFRGVLVVKSDLETKTFQVEYKKYIHGFVQFYRIESLQYSFKTHYGVTMSIQPVSFYTSINENTYQLKNARLMLYKTNVEMKTVTSLQLDLENSISLKTEDDLDYLKREVVVESARIIEKGPVEEGPVEEETSSSNYQNEKGCFSLFPSDHPTKKTKILQMNKKDFSLKTSNTLRTTRSRKEARRVNPGCMPRMWRKTHQFAK